MIDWSVILFLAIALLIFHMKEFGEHTEVQSYLYFPENKVSSSTLSLLFRLLTGTFIFIPFYLTVYFGFYSGLLLAIAGGAVLYFFSKKIERVRENYAVYQNHGDFFANTFSKTGVWPFYLILLISGSEGLILSGLLANSFMESVFGISPIWTNALLLFFSFVFAGIGGAGGVRKVGLWLQYFFFVGITVLPIGTVLIRGVDSIRESFNRLPVVNMQPDALLLISFLFLFFIAGQILVYLFITRDLLEIKKTQLRTTFGLTSICWSAMPLAVSILVIYFMARTGETELTRLLPKLGGALSFSLLYILIISVLCCFALSMGVALHNVTSLIHVVFKNKLSIRFGYGASFFVSLFVYLVFISLKPDIKIVLFFYLNLFIVLSFPFWLLLTTKVRWGWDFSFIIAVATILGVSFSARGEWILGATASLGLAVLLFIVVFIRKVRRI